MTMFHKAKSDSLNFNESDVTCGYVLKKSKSPVSPEKAGHRSTRPLSQNNTQKHLCHSTFCVCINLSLGQSANLFEISSELSVNFKLVCTVG